MRKKLYKILAALGLTEKFESRTLSADEFHKVAAEYLRIYGTPIETALANIEGEEEGGEAGTAGQSGQSGTAGQSGQSGEAGTSGISGTAEPAQAATPAPATPDTLSRIYAAVQRIDPTAPVANGGPAPSAQEIIAAIDRVGERFMRMAQQPVPEGSQENPGISGIAGQPGSPRLSHGTYLFGIPHEIFSMEHRWNRIAANPRAARSMADPSDDEVRSFYRSVHSYSRSLQQRYAYLQQNAMLNADLLATGEFSNDYDGVTNAGLGNQYVIRRQDALIARVLKKRQLTQWFPVRYGVQDRDLLFNAYFGELSQAYQKGEIYKGDLKIENEMGYVDDAMIKMQFGPMKELERMYIAYLNRDGSDPMKWSMIEFCILNELETAQVEQNKRRIRGIYVKPEAGVAGSYLNAGTGLVYTLLRYIHEYSIKPHDDEDYRSYTSATMLEAVQAFVADVTTSLSEDMDLSQHVLYLNERHKPWWIKNIRETYHLDQDFTGPGSLANHVPDTDIPIIWLPYLGSLPLMLLDVPGNLQFIEYIPGEMLAVKMEEQMEMVRAWSTWKEGCGAAFTGRKFATKAAMDANAYEWQQIFINLPAYTVEADKTTIDGANGFWQLTPSNTAAKALTDITNAKEGVAYCIECAGTTNATTIAKSGKFANLTAAYTPTAVGDYIMVILGSDGKFRELERRVGGTRTINQATQPNTIGGR